MEKKSTRGGFRVESLGKSGRKPKGNEPRVNLSCTVDSRTINYINSLTEHMQKSRGEVVDAAIGLLIKKQLK